MDMIESSEIKTIGTPDPQPEGEPKGPYRKTKYPGIFIYAGKKGMAYGIDYYAGGKKHREIVGPRLGEAKKKLEERRALAKKGIVIQKRITFRKLAQKYVELYGEKSFYRGSQKYFIGYWDENQEWQDMSLTRYFGDDKIFQITPLRIENFRKSRKETPVKGPWNPEKKAHTEKERSDVSVNRELEILRHLLNKAIEWSWLDENPFQRFKGESIFFEEKNDRVRFLEQNEITRLLAVAPLYLQNILKAAIYTGLRKGDLLGLKWSDIDFNNKVLVFKEQKKHDKSSIKHLGDDMMELLMEILRAKEEFINIPLEDAIGILKDRGEFIFLGPKGTSVKNVSRSFKTALRRAGIKDFRFHDLRHTSASHLLMRGASLKTIQEHLGHTTLAMTQRYSHLSRDFQREEVNRLNGLCEENSNKLVRNEQSENKPQMTTTATA